MTHCIQVLVIVIALLLVGCDNGNPPTSTPTAAPQATATLAPTATDTRIANTPPPQADTSPAPTGSPIDAAAVTEPPTPDESAPSPTAVTSTSSGNELTALQALAVLKPKAVAWHADAQLALLSNARPGQQKNLLGDALGKPDINEPTPGGKGRDWTLIAVSPASRAAIAISMDGTQVDLVKEGTITNDMLDRFAAPGSSALTLAQLNLSNVVDSDKIAQAAGERGKSPDIGVALIAPDGLGVGPLPTPATGGPAPKLAYELFTQSNSSQGFIFFDAMTGAVVLDSAGP